MDLFNSPQRTSSAQQRFVGGGQNTGMRTPPSAPYQDSNRSNDDYYRSYTGTEKIVLRVQIYKKNWLHSRASQLHTKHITRLRLKVHTQTFTQ